MNNTFSAYIAAFDELNILTSTSYYSASGKDMTSKVAQIADDILSLLIRAYQQGKTRRADGGASTQPAKVEDEAGPAPASASTEPEDAPEPSAQDASSLRFSRQAT